MISRVIAAILAAFEIGYDQFLKVIEFTVSMGIESGTLSGIENGTLWTGPCGGSVATGAGAGPEW